MREAVAEKLAAENAEPIEYYLHPESPRILVVDDEKVIRDILADFLSVEGYVVRTVEDGAKALEELHRAQLQPGHLRPEDAAAWAASSCSRRSPRRAMPGADGHHDRLRHRRDRHRGDEARRLRLHPQALQGRGGRPHRPARPRSPAPAAREPSPQGRAVHLQASARPSRPRCRWRRCSTWCSRPTLETVDADVVSLCWRTRRARRGPGFVERMRKVSPERRRRDGPRPAEPRRGAAALPARIAPLLVHGSRAAQLLGGADRPLQRQLVSFCSIPLKLNGRIIGMLNAYSYTQRRPVQRGPAQDAVRARQPRRCLHRERAPVREPGRRQQGPDAANVSLEENFKQTIIGFAHALEESDRYTRGHSERVAMYARLIAVGLRLPSPKSRPSSRPA